MAKYFKDTRPGYFRDQVYQELKPLRLHINPPTPTAVVVKNRYGVLVWKGPIHLAPATKQDYQKQKN
jgi:hypothetical protein